MKKIICLALLIICLIGCKEKSVSKNFDDKKDEFSLVDKDKEEGVLMLKEFYQSFYFDENKKIDNDELKKYVSEQLLLKINNLRNEDNFILDYDPFIKAQDFNGESIKNTLEIIPLETKNEFKVSFIIFGKNQEQRTYIDFLLEKNSDNKFLIKSVINDENLNSRSEHIRNFNKWFGNYEGAFLRMKDESADPRGWATINIDINKDYVNFHIFSYLEEKDFKLTFNKEDNESIVFNMNDESVVKLTYEIKENKYILECEYIDDLMKQKQVVELLKK